MNLDIHKFKRHLQDHFSDGLVIIIGSGLSCAESLPSMGELTAHLTSILRDNLTGMEAEEWIRILPMIADQGLEAALLKHPPSPVLESSISAATVQLISGEEQKVIKEIFNGKRKLRLTRLISHLLKPDCGLPIITTNYDRLIEVAVENAGFGVDTMFIGHLAGQLNPTESRLSFCTSVTKKNGKPVLSYRQRALILKPHGSLDWYLCNGKPVRFGGELSGVPRLIITPGRNKFRIGYDSPFDVHRERANKAIDKASRFLIVGYGFNDDHLETHLITAIKRGCPTLLLTYELSKTAYDIATNYTNVTALDKATEKNIVGTRAIHSNISYFLPDLELWDLEKFVNEVLEP